MVYSWCYVVLDVGGWPPDVCASILFVASPHIIKGILMVYWPLCATRLSTHASTLLGWMLVKRAASRGVQRCMIRLKGRRDRYEGVGPISQCEGLACAGSSCICVRKAVWEGRGEIISLQRKLEFGKILLWKQTKSSHSSEVAWSYPGRELELGVKFDSLICCWLRRPRCNCFA